jgi:hypothetical protein
MGLFDLNQDCWESILSFVDIKTCGRLYLCSRHMDTLAKAFWRKRCEHYFGEDFSWKKQRVHYVGDDFPTSGEGEVYRRILGRVLSLKHFAKLKHEALAARWCFPAVAEATPINVDPLHWETVVPNATQYDFYIRLRVQNGRQLVGRFYPGESVLIDNHHSVCFRLPEPPSWPGLCAAQRYFDRNDRDSDARVILSKAWDCTSVVIVGMRRGQSTPMLVAAAFSFPFTEEAVHEASSMDFDDGRVLSFMKAGDSYWYFLHSEMNEYGEESSPPDLGFVVSAHSLNWIVLCDRLIT